MKPLRALAAAVLCTFIAGCALRQSARPTPAAEPGMMEIPRGEFVMGRDSGPLNEQPAHDVGLDRYFLDRTEVSAADFAAFLNAEGNPDGRYFTADELATIVETPGPGGSPRFEPRVGFSAHPANNVSWHGAEAYCRWRGRRLPTEAEWEKAARGTDERSYPWGESRPDARRSRFAQSWTGGRLDVLVPVDALPDGASAYGLVNMAGNVLEWVHDWYRQNLCDFCSPDREAHPDVLRQLTSQQDPAAEPAAPTGEADSGRQAPPRDNPPGPTTGIFRVLRGGSWQEVEPEDLLTTRRYWLDPAQRFPTTGFRCAKDPEEQAQEPGRP